LILPLDFSAVLTARSGDPTPGTFAVGPWQVELDAPPEAVHRQHGLVALFKGQVYDTDLAGVLRLYRQHGPDFPRQFEGSFSLLLLDQAQGAVLAVTDRLGTHKLYAVHESGRVTVSTLPDHPDFTWRPYRPAGLASALTSGMLVNNLTLYEGVQSLLRASLHDVQRGGIQSRPYWQLRPPEGLDRRPEAELRQEYAELLRCSVRRRTAGLSGPVHLSLSGGHDSRGLLSLLSSAGCEVRTFSYAQGAQLSRSDASMAGPLAVQYGSSHQRVQAYRGDLLATLRRNARWGRGMTNFCDEVDAWDTLASGPITDVFVGDELHEISPFRLHDVSDSMVRRHIEPFSSLGALAACLTPAARHDLEASWDAELGQIRAQAARYPDPYQQDFLIMGQHYLCHSLLPWRERFAGRVAAVHTPYLDGALADFIHRLPPDLLAGKRLFIGALRALDPGIYRVPLARSSGYETDWNAELVRHRDAVKEQLLAGPSRLDRVIEPQAIHAVLDSLTVPNSGRGTRKATFRSGVRRTLGTFRHSTTGQRLFGQPRHVPSDLSPATWLLRVLTLRIVEAEPRGGWPEA
jgi:asparagine synthase (glutamine-hydrolysing)